MVEETHQTSGRVELPYVFPSWPACGSCLTERGDIRQLDDCFTFPCAQKIADLEAQLERQDVRGTALRAAIARLQEYGSSANAKAEEADKDLLGLDRELTILKANVRLLAHSLNRCCHAHLFESCQPGLSPVAFST